MDAAPDRALLCSTRRDVHAEQAKLSLGKRFRTEEEREFMLFGVLKMVLMEQVSLSLSLSPPRPPLYRSLFLSRSSPLLSLPPSLPPSLSLSLSLSLCLGFS